MYPAAVAAPRPGRGEPTSDGSDAADPRTGEKPSDRIHDVPFADRIEEQEVVPHG
jgi:hypothetical protein